MSRFTGPNIIKLVLAFCCFPLVCYLVLVLGLRSKNKNLIIEGSVYAVLMTVAFVLPSEGDQMSDFAGGLMMLALIPSAIRSYMLRDMWLPRPTFVPPPPALQQGYPAPQQAFGAPQHAPGPTSGWQPVPAVGLPVSRSGIDDLSSTLAWVISQGKQNKHRIPSSDYVTILETCHTLDEVIDTQRAQGGADAQFEFEMEAMVREYLPTVLKSYLAVPPSMVNDPQPNGRTPNQELTEQLELLSGHADALHSSRHRQTSADLTSSGNFLREKFGHQKPGGFDFGIH